MLSFKGRYEKVKPGLIRFFDVADMVKAIQEIKEQGFAAWNADDVKPDGNWCCPSYKKHGYNTPNVQFFCTQPIENSGGYENQISIFITLQDYNRSRGDKIYDFRALGGK
jgi:hypothetical protein